MLVIQFKKTDCNTKINQIEKKITNHNYDECITTQEFNIKIITVKYSKQK